MTTSCRSYVFTTSTVPATGPRGGRDLPGSATLVIPPFSKRIDTIALKGMAAFVASAEPSGHTPEAAAAGLRRGRKGVDGEELGRGTIDLAHDKRSCLRCLGLAPAERGTVDPHPMQDHRQLACDGHLCALETATLSHLQSPALERRETRDPREQHVRRLVKGRPNHLVANARDPARDVRFARLVSLRRQSKERSGIPRLLDPMRIIKRRLVGDCHDRTDTRRGHEPAANLVVADNVEDRFVQLLELD